MALVNQYTQSAGQGNANHVLYKLASSQAQTGANCNSSATPASGCIFNDITSGTIATPCAALSLNCTLSNAGDLYGVLSGYSAGTGYDLATGLGSVNAYNLVHGWSKPGISTTTTLSLNSNKAVNITHGQSVPFNITVSPSAATGNVSLIGSPVSRKLARHGKFSDAAKRSHQRHNFFAGRRDFLSGKGALCRGQYLCSQRFGPCNRYGGARAEQYADHDPRIRSQNGD